MTMLDRMRRHRNTLKWSLAIVVLAFVLLYIPPEWLGNNPQLTGGAAIATVEGREITVNRFRQAYQQQIQQMRANFGGQMDERMIRQFGIDRRIVQQMVEEEAALAEAERLGIKASDAEVRARILALPVFQENGRFVGDTRYRQILDMMNPPLRPSEFEEQVRRGIVVEKLQGALTDWINVSDKDVDAEFKKRNEKVKLAVVSFPSDKFRESVTAADDEISQYFEEHKNEYRMPEKRKVRYAMIDMQAMRARTTVSTEDIRRQYEDNKSQYSQPEEVRASHILLKTEGKDEAAVKAQAEELLAKAKAPGADFAKLASQHTEEEAGKTRGGDLDFFKRGAMVPEFEKVAFALQPGQINDTVVKTQFGYHIIKVVDKQPPRTVPLDEVKPQIEQFLQNQQRQQKTEAFINSLKAKGKVEILI